MTLMVSQRPPSSFLDGLVHANLVRDGFHSGHLANPSSWGAGLAQRAVPEQRTPRHFEHRARTKPVGSRRRNARPFRHRAGRLRSARKPAPRAGRP